MNVCASSQSCMAGDWEGTDRKQAASELLKRKPESILNSVTDQVPWTQKNAEH